MSVLIDEVGAIAAESIQTILSENAEDSARPWKKLVDGGWAALGADPEAELSLRAVQEMARVVGRYAVSVPLVPTLLAGRWFTPSPDVLAAGIGLALPHRDRGQVAYATDDMHVLDAAGEEVGRARVGPVEDSFSAVMPVAAVEDGVAPLPPDRAAELHAALAASAVGCADTVLERAADWSQTRSQFGQPIRTFQAVRHHLADMHINREQAWTAAIACANEPESAATWSRTACRLACDTIETGIQVHGGVGFTWEVGLQHFLCHVLQISSLLAELGVSGSDAGARS